MERERLGPFSLNPRITPAVMTLRSKPQSTWNIKTTGKSELTLSQIVSPSSPACGSGMTPMMEGATGTGQLWKLSVGSSTGQSPAVSISEEPGGVQTIRWDLPSVVVPAQSSLVITWVAHLAKGGSTNLACAQASPMQGCSPSTVLPSMGEGSWPGRSLQVRACVAVNPRRENSLS